MSSDDDDLRATFGATIGSRVARLVADATATTRQKMAPHQAAVAQKVLADFTNHVSDEVRGIMNPLWNVIAEGDVSPWMADLTGSLGTKRGQAFAWIGGTSTSMALGGGLMLVVQNELSNVVGGLIRMKPMIPLAPADAAAIAARGLGSADSLWWENAAKQGINRERFDMLTDLNRSTLSGGDVIELLRRNLLTKAQAKAALMRGGMLEAHATMVLALARNQLSIADAAAMWNRDIISTMEGHAIAQGNGYTFEDFDNLALLGGEPPAISELLLAWRRGIITESEVDRAIIQGPLRKEWIPVIKSLQWQPLPPQEAADAVTQGHMPVERARAIAAESGIKPEDFDIVIANSGLPPGLEVATEAWNRGLITEAEFTSAFLESRLKNQYVPLYKALRWRVIPQETVRRLYREGVYTEAQALERLAWNGFSPEDRVALLAAEDTGTSDATKELTKSEILSLYSDRAIDAPATIEMLKSIGYGQGEIDWVLMIADLRRERRYADAVIARIRAGYVAYRLDESDASSIMDSLRIPPDQRDELLSLWDLERLATTRGLTPAQIKAAHKKGFIDESEAISRLRQEGYTDDDAGLLLRI